MENESKEYQEAKNEIWITSHEYEHPPPFWQCLCGVHRLANVHRDSHHFYNPRVCQRCQAGRQYHILPHNKSDQLRMAKLSTFVLSPSSV